MLNNTDLTESMKYLVEQGAGRQDLADQLAREKETPIVYDLKGLPVTTRKFERFLSPEPAAIGVTTLSGLVDYCKANPDELELDSLLCHVVSPVEVVLRSKLTGPYLQRPEYVRCRASTLPNIYFDCYMETEQFNIMLLACFEPSEHRAKLLAVTGNVDASKGMATVDDGVTQEVVVRAGINRKDTCDLPSPILLRPQRTFPEVEQPESGFILRGKQINDDGEVKANFKLVEADGGAWRGVAMSSIKEFLVTAEIGVKVIA